MTPEWGRGSLILLKTCNVITIVLLIVQGVKQFFFFNLAVIYKC